jgi:hypothetical protein
VRRRSRPRSRRPRRRLVARAGARGDAGHAGGEVPPWPHRARASAALLTHQAGRPAGPAVEQVVVRSTQELLAEGLPRGAVGLAAAAGADLPVGAGGPAGPVGRVTRYVHAGPVAGDERRRAGEDHDAGVGAGAGAGAGAGVRSRRWCRCRCAVGASTAVDVPGPVRCPCSVSIARLRARRGRPGCRCRSCPTGVRLAAGRHLRLLGERLPRLGPVFHGADVRRGSRRDDAVEEIPGCRGSWHPRRWPRCRRPARSPIGADAVECSPRLGRSW